MNPFLESKKGRPLGWRKFYQKVDKRCSKCKEAKLLKFFYNDATRNDGKCAYCMDCKLKYNRSLKCPA
jgi:hypothetical protein